VVSVNQFFKHPIAVENKHYLPFCITVTGLLMLSLASGCRKQTAFREIAQKDKTIDLEQTITSTVHPKDSLFIHFNRHWQKLISPKLELMHPVKSLKQPVAWNPLVTSDCVFSPGAGKNVPKIDISWVEDIGQQDDASIRVDLSILYHGYERNSYTTIYPLENQKRFNLPANSALVKDSAAVLLTGIALFPKLTHFSNEKLAVKPDQLKLRTGNLKNYHLVLEELGAGLAYNIRVCRYNGETWNEEKHYVFTTPICTQKY
jgi:hypothetical protein